jgi:hypothetical protein
MEWVYVNKGVRKIAIGHKLHILKDVVKLFSSIHPSRHPSVSSWSVYPDKLCNQVSDVVLDACLEQDPDSKVACETCTKTNTEMPVSPV